MEKYIPAAQKFVSFVTESVSPYHAVENAKKILEAAGYKLLSERQQWQLNLGGKYYFTRNQSTIVAFAVGQKYKPGNGFNIVAAHTDSPNLKIRPHSAVEGSGGYLQVGCELYGGGIWATWFDRDLTVAGRVMVQKGDKYEAKLVNVKKPILRIPTLAIHLDRSINEAFKFNTQQHLVPILATSAANQLNKSLPAPSGEKPNHHPLLLDILSKQLDCKVDEIKSFDLNLVDTQPSTIGGAYDEFIFSPRLDNLCMSYCSLQALIEGTSDSALANETNVNVMMLFDNEEVGSSSCHGAASPLVLDVIHRVTSLNDPSSPSGLVDVAIRNSFLVSADMAHAVHPNYSSNHEPLHQPKMNQGTVIKHNANLRYTTIAPTGFVILELARRNNVPVQEFVVKNDSPCGSTIGPIMSALAGLRAVDIGNPQLSMHSCREQCGTADITHGIALLKAFFEQFTALDAQITVDA
eukprot:TRINITY_DN1250_c0_g1_i1.p1 TRINITY_DN1250_c0_g1~~TRINITY_DN1250_c0_g1_i1.p1  ORF type:complete len:465 (+),score=99.86 TRINITY_DN1250_c0_g1_i1:12-1406(+)